MKHIVQEGINTKTKQKKQQSGGIFEDLMKTLSNKKNREILSNKPLRQMCGHGRRLFNRALLDPSASSFFKFLATGGANRLYKVELNTKVLLSITNFYKTQRHVLNTV